jgi:signal transduction histidine kinase/FixJ family two-component response regulator
MVDGQAHAPRVILVDDDPATRRALARMLRGGGWEVAEAAGALAALSLVDQRAPDVVLADLSARARGGAELIEALKERAPGVPVVVMTGSREGASAVRAGAAGYLTKPIELDAVLLALGRAMERARLDAEAHGLRWQREITAALVEARLDVSAILGALARHTAQSLGDLCALRLLSDDGTTLLPAVFHHRDPDAIPLLRDPLSRPRPLGPGIFAEVLSSREARLVSPLTTEDRAELSPGGFDAYCARYGMSSVILAPLHVRGAPLGLLSCARGRHERPYGPLDVTLVRDLADRASIAIENARLYEQLQAQVKQVEKAKESLRKAEVQLGQAQRLEALGRLSGGVAHDFNNVLSVVIGYADLLLEEEPLSDAGRAKVRGILQSARHAAALTGQLLAFGRQQVLEPRIVDLNEILRGMADMLRRLIGQHVELELHLASALGSVRVDPAKIQQVVMNLVLNARDAMPRGGRVTIRTANERPSPPSSAPPEAPAPSGFAMIEIADTGAGMDSATVARIFEPFFTTKAAGKGTGLGLATVLGIVQQSGGHITVDSHPGEGTVFQVYFPHAQGVPIKKSSRPKMRTGQGAETILLVDDDDDVRIVTRRLLERAGYRVLAAATPTEARALSDSEKGPIALLLTDMVMPGATGIDLVRSLSPGRPEMRVIYMSGYAQDAADFLGDPPEEAAFLQKPIARDTLLAKVRSVLDAP